VAYPAVPRGQGVLRLSVMSTHTDEQLRVAADIVAAAVRAVRTDDEAAAAVA
jgi:8-amino-7-oxononanoate synthase